jgi:hypothetical protein
MNYEYDEIDRALFALPLEEPPKGLRQSILALTVHAPLAAEERIGWWESLAIGLGLALAAFLAWLVVTNPAFGAQIVAVLVTFGRILSEPPMLAALTAGCSAVAWVSLMTFRPARVEVRSNRA